MKVSVIIPTHNRLEQITRCYQSVCQQTRIPEEIIIIDDGSTTPVNSIAEILNYPSITTIIKRIEIPKGACQARNYGANIATGNILMFLDDDDTWEEKKIESQLKIFTSNPHIGLVYSGRLMVRQKNRDRIVYKIEPQAKGKIYPEILYRNLIGTTSSVAITKTLFNILQGFDEQMPALQDYDLWIRASQQTLVGHDNSCNVRYTIPERSQSQISSQPERYRIASQRAISKYNRQIGDRGLLGSRKIKSGLYFFVAKSFRIQGIIKAIPWIFRSFVEYPNFKILFLLLPTDTIYSLQSIITGSKKMYKKIIL